MNSGCCAYLNILWIIYFLNQFLKLCNLFTKQLFPSSHVSLTNACLSDYHAPVRHGTSFERRTTRSQTAYVPQQSYQQHAHVNRSQISARPKTTVNITPSPNPASSAVHHTPHQTAAPVSSVAFLQQSVSQPSLTQGFQNLNISANDGATGPAALAGPKSWLPVGDSTGSAVDAAVRRSHSFTSPSTTAQQQYPYGKL